MSKPILVYIPFFFHNGWQVPQFEGFDAIPPLFLPFRLIRTVVDAASTPVGVRGGGGGHVV